MRVGCDNCGGPLHGRRCEGYCRSRGPLVQRTERKSTKLEMVGSNPPGASNTTKHNGSFLEWRCDYVSDRGVPTNAGIWRGYRVTPEGHSIQVYPKR